MNETPAQPPPAQPPPAQPPPVPPVSSEARAAARWISGRPRPVLKLLTIGGLILVLLIPLQMIRGVLTERLVRRNEAVAEITGTWGGDQTVIGPVLMVPYRYPVKTVRDQTVDGRVQRVEVEEMGLAQAFFLPDRVEIAGDLDPRVLHRGIYRAVVYRGRLTIEGAFARPSFEDWRVPPENVLWEDAAVGFAITDLRGVEDALQLDWNGRAVPLEPGSLVPGFNVGVTARLRETEALEADDLPFALTLALNGSNGIRFAPVGARNTARLTSSWPDPSFQGQFLPADRTVGPEGFEAQWALSYYGRAYPQQWTVTPGAGARPPALGSALFGVDLRMLVDQYRNVERAIKYGILFLVLVFTGFFLFETLGVARVHPFQYALVGAALCLFYLALLSLSEFIRFGAAYLVGAAAATAMISLYCASVLRGGRRAAIVAVELAAIYGFLFVLLQLQDYALLIGTAGLFAALGAVMYLTRNVNWYEQRPASGG